MDNKKIMIISINLNYINRHHSRNATFSKLWNNWDNSKWDKHRCSGNQTNYHGPFEDIKLWNWENGALVSYNSHEGSRATVKKYDRDLHPIK